MAATRRNRAGGDRRRPAAPPRLPATEIAPTVDESPSRNSALLVTSGAVILLMTVVAYVPAMHGEFVWDDNLYVSENDTLSSSDGLSRIWFDIGATPQYYPLVFTMFWAERQLWGLDTFGYHVVNVLLHGLTAVLLWFVLRKLAVPGAWLAAAVFALHPVHVESVAWITERKNVLSGVFYMATLLAYLRFSGLPNVGGTPRRWGYYGLALLLFVCALFSKTVTCTLPAVLLLLVWWKAGRLRAEDVLPVVPMFVIGAALGLTIAATEANVVGAHGAEWDFSPVDRVLIAGRVAWFYLGKLLWPANLSFVYYRWQVDAAQWWQYLFPAAVAAVLAVLVLMRRRIGRGPLVAMLFFGGTLFPALGFFNVYFMRYSFVADHFQYLASIGPIVLAASVLTWLGRMKKGTGASPKASVGTVSGNPLGAGPLLQRPPFGVVICGTVVLLVLGTLTWRQSRVFANLETLWRDTLAKNPSAWSAHNNLGNLLFKRGDYAEAAKCYAEAVRLKPDFPQALGGVGISLARSGRHAEAVSYFERAVALRPHSAMQHRNLALSLTQVGRSQEAAEHFRQAIKFKPDWAEAHSDFASSLLRQGDMATAERHCREALRLDPTSARAYGVLAAVLSRQDKLDEAIETYQKALDLDPESPAMHNNLANALYRKGDTAGAISQYRQALKRAPRDADTHCNLGIALMKSGNHREAVAELERAVAIDPSLTRAHRALRDARANLPSRSDGD